MRLLGLLFLAVSSAAAQSTDRLVGVWETDPEAVELGVHTAPLFRRVIFRTEGTNLVESLVNAYSSNDQPAASMVYSVDGRPSLGKAGDVEVTMTARWSDGKLVIVWRAADKSVLYREILLSPDGRTMTVEVSNQEDPDKPDQVLVLHKKP